MVQDGEPAAVLIDASEFAGLREHRRFLDAVRAGLADVVRPLRAAAAL